LIAVKAESEPAPDNPGFALPKPFLDWFARKGWQPRAHQLDLLSKAEAGKSALLIAPTGAGKTLAGFLPSLVDLTRRGKPKPGERKPGVHTLYISPLKALAVDIARNLTTPIEEMGLPVRIETRTGDTPAARRQRQKLNPPDILLTTPEQLALLLSQAMPNAFRRSEATGDLDELHALVTSKRGDLLALGLARLHRLCPRVAATGLSATVADPDLLPAGWCRRMAMAPERADIVTVAGGAKPTSPSSKARNACPGPAIRRAMPMPMSTRRSAHRTTLLFVNTRSQAELLFQELWRINDDNLPIALHHGSLDVGQRRKVEQAMGTMRLRAVVATSTLDLGIDWGDVDLVVHVGAPKGASRLAQRIGRANHRMDEASKAILVPANRFEVMECQAALDAYLGAQDTPPLATERSTCLPAHILGVACADAFLRRRTLREITFGAYSKVSTRDMFDRAVQFVATGGYALKSYERYARIRQTKDGTWRIAHPDVAQQYRLNVGTIIESADADGQARLTARQAAQRSPGALRGGRILGQVEEYFLETLAPGDTFLFAGEVLRLRGHSRDRTASSRGQRPPIRKCRPMPAASFRSRPICRSRCARCCPILTSGRGCRSRFPIGWRSRRPNPSCPARRNCWSRHIRAETASTWSPTPSRAASHTRRSACF
jgi:ATP-dependent Lhr-like helicase